MSDKEATTTSVADTSATTSMKKEEVASSSDQHTDSSLDHSDQNTDGAGQSEMVEDLDAAAAVEAARKKAAMPRPRQPGDPWKSADLSTLEVIQKMFQFSPDKKKARDGANFSMVFAAIPGSRNITIQDQVQLANHFAQYEDKKEREAREAALQQYSKQGQDESDESEASGDASTTEKRSKTPFVPAAQPMNTKEDYSLTFTSSDYTKHFGFWQSIDDFVRDKCKMMGREWWGKPMSDEWLGDNYNHIWTGLWNHKDQTPRQYPQVKLKVKVDGKTGKPMMEYIDEKGEVRYRHSDHAPTLAQWVADDEKYKKKHGHSRPPYMTVKEMQADLVRSAVVKFLWHYRGVGYSKRLGKVNNFGFITKIALVSHATGNANPDFLDD